MEERTRPPYPRVDAFLISSSHAFPIEEELSLVEHFLHITMVPPKDGSDETGPLLNQPGHAAVTYDATSDDGSSAGDDGDHADDHTVHTEGTSVLIQFRDNVAEVLHDGFDVVTEVAGEVTHAVMDVAETVEHVAVDVVEELQSTIVEIFAPEPEEDLPAEDEAFSMQLTRGTSILPSDIAYAAHKMDDLTHPADEEGGLGFEEETTGIPISAYFMLVLAVVGLSSIGPLLDLQAGVSATLKIIWRTQATALLLLPFAIYGIHEEGLPTLSAAQFIILLAASACYASMCVLFAWSLDYTTVGNAVICKSQRIPTMFCMCRVQAFQLTSLIR